MGCAEEAEVVGDDVGEGEVGGQGNDPAQGLVALVEGFRSEVGGDGDSTLDRRENQVVLNEGFHDGVAFGKMGVFEAFPGGDEIGDVESDQRQQRGVEHGVGEPGAAEAGSEDGLGRSDRNESGVEGDPGEIGLGLRGGGGGGREHEGGKASGGKERGFAQGGVSQGDAGKEGD